MNYGEIWQLGEHRLMCGDATNKADIERLIDGEKVDLILTDPPYGMKCQRQKNSVKKYNLAIMIKERDLFNGRRNADYLRRTQFVS